jgi:hypothetical protein
MKSATYELMFQCYVSGQMSVAQLQAHMGDDEVFRAWLERHMAVRQKELR